MLCILKKIKTGFETKTILFSRKLTHQMKNRILSKNKGRLFFLLPKLYQLPEYCTMFTRKIFFSRIWGTAAPALCPSAPPAPMNDVIKLLALT